MFPTKSIHTVLRMRSIPLAIAAALLVSCGKPADDPGRKVQFYQSPMHPWIKSDKPGKCTICGMDLVPVYEGEKTLDTEGNITTLNPSSIQVIGVGTATVRRAPIDRTITVAGVIDDDETRHRVLSAYVSGRIEKLYVNYVGADVRKGEPLAEIYSPDLLATEKEYRLASAQSAASPLTQNARRRLVQLGLNEDQIRALTAKPDDRITSDILSPMTGSVVAKDVYEGQYVNVGDRLFELADFSTMWFMADVYERDLPYVKVGQKAQVRTDALPGRPIDGTVTFIDPNFNEQTRSTKVRIELPNPDRAIPHRVYATGTIEDVEGDALVVPRSAVLDTGARAVAYVPVGEGSYERRDVTIGRRGSEFIEVLGGLREGETVVTNGNLLIDAEAQMAAGGPHSHGAQAPPAVPASEHPDALSPLFSTVEALGAALANDDLSAFNDTLPQLQSALGALPQDLPKESAQTLHTSGHPAPAPDLKAARKAFEPLADAVAALALAQARAGHPAPLVFECPMTATAFEDAPPRARWVQARPPLQNPYLGARMISCGSEVKP